MLRIFREDGGALRIFRDDGIVDVYYGEAINKTMGPGSSLGETEMMYLTHKRKRPTRMSGPFS